MSLSHDCLEGSSWGGEREGGREGGRREGGKGEREGGREGGEKEGEKKGGRKGGGKKGGRKGGEGGREGKTEREGGIGGVHVSSTKGEPTLHFITSDSESLKANSCNLTSSDTIGSMNDQNDCPSERTTIICEVM